MTLLSLIVAFVVVGLVLWLVNRFVPMEPPALKPILNVAVVVIMVFWMLSATGLLSYLNRPIMH